MNLTFVLLCISVWINYIDRGNLGVAAPVLQPELGLGPTELGVLLSAFFWTYSLLQPVAGWLVDRYDAHRLYAASFALWSLAVAAGGLVHGFTALLITRLALGVGESLAYPAYSRILTTSFAEHQRGFANALIDIGTKGGPALGMLLGGWMIASYGWRAFFLVMGLGSLVWLIPWWRARPVKPVLHAKRQAFTGLLKRRPVWVTCAGLFCFNYAYYFLLTWLPSYLVNERNFSLKAMAIYGALPYAATAVASLTAGWATDRAIRNGRSVDRTRKPAAVSGLVVAALLLPAAALAPLTPAMICLVIAFAAIGVFTSNAWAITQTLAGKEAAGTWTGIQNAVGNMGGVAAPILTGWSVAQSGSFVTAFLVSSAMLALSALCYGLLIGKLEPINWNSEAGIEAVENIRR
jgi:MFS family permease